MTYGPKIAGQQSMRIARKRIWEAERIGWVALGACGVVEGDAAEVGSQYDQAVAKEIKREFLKARNVLKASNGGGKPLQSRKTVQMKHALAILALAILALVTGAAQAGDWHAPKQSPDDFSNAGFHFMLVGALPGILVGTSFPDMHPAKQFALCSIPGVVHEMAPSKGNVWSGRDLLVNSIGCGMGLWASTGFALGTTPTGGVRLTYSASFK